MAGPLHPVFHCKRAQTSGVPAPPVLLPDRILRQSDLSSPLDKLGERLLDVNRTIGQPNKITVIFGRKVTKQYRGKLQTEIQNINLPNPVIRDRSIEDGTVAGAERLPVRI